MAQDDVWRMVMAVVFTAALTCAGTYLAVSGVDERYDHNVVVADFKDFDFRDYVANDLFEPDSQISDSEIKSFGSFDEFGEFRERHTIQSYYAYEERWDMAEGAGAPMAATDASSGNGVAYQTETNIQVAGVDEGDMVKNDGEYAYIISSSGESVFIVLAYPPERASVLCEIQSPGMFIDMYLEGDELIMLEQVYYFEGGYQRSSYMYSNLPMINLKAYDISNRSSPELSNQATLAGNYLTSRLIDGNIYVIGNQYIQNWENESQLPVPLESLYYLENDDSAYSITTFLTYDMEMDDAAPSIMGIVMSSSNNIYVSLKNIYITHGGYRETVGIFGDSYESTETTVIHRIGIQGQSLKYKARGEVPGRLLNRFSMDEFDGHFRVATTKGQSWGGGSENMVRVLDMALEQNGALDGIAPGEQIYSARFMGTRLYLVTFRQVDPFYVIDLHDAEKPKILGALKIPGYSSYLHPYDENHIIGLGKDGHLLKIALFNVSDVQNPTELDTITIGSANDYTDSLALNDPHAFMFSREKGVLVIPVSGYRYGWGQRGDGAYVFDISPEDGISQRGIVEHGSPNAFESDYYGYDNNYNPVKRSFIINDTLYTVSDRMMKASGIQGLDTLASVELD